jgi:hypothetical protein
VITRSSWARVIPHVATGSIARTESSATPCNSSSKDSVDNNNPANSDKAAPTPTGTGWDMALGTSPGDPIDRDTV